MRLYGNSVKEVGVTFEQYVRTQLARLCMPAERIDEFMSVALVKNEHPTGFDGIQWDHDIGLYHEGRQSAVFSPVRMDAASWVAKNYGSDWYLPVMNHPGWAEYNESSEESDKLFFMKSVVDEWEHKGRVPVYPEYIKEYMRNRQK